ncbi:zinc finger protein 420 [Gadus chalcogrammus]|uniref:zinc finger protein 420 n=1 Tax=Gadus chalcogrammus TaxID=1042646 RepID=UPI0024C4AEEA|nr:zinc finger protein 420 [Gadus chalcogrammus]
MDKDKPADGNGQCSWFEMQQFIGDLITSGNSSSQSLKEQHDVLHVSWGLAGGEYLGLKGPAQDKSDLDQNRLMLSGAPERRAEFRDRKEVENELHACTCTGCPFSTSPPSYETLKPRKSLYSHGQPDKTCLSRTHTSPPAMNLSVCLPDENQAEPSSTTSSDLKPRASRREDRERNADCSSSSRGLAGSFPHFPMFACLCCHGLQTCAQLLRQQEGPDSGLPHGNAHGHHIHHHHCPFSSCLPCPQLAHSHPHAAQLRGHFPYLGCHHAISACPQHSHKQNVQKPGQPNQEEGARATTAYPPFMHPCMHCSAAFQRPSQLLQHQRSEHSQKPAGFLCTECGKAFNSHSNLRIHQNVHTGARPYVCPDCGKSFSQSGALKIHKRIHTGERPYSCAFCGRGFPHLAGVRAHQRTHTGEKPYRCGLCGKCFTQSGALKIHTRMHTGERPFTCGVCEKGFTNLAAIRFHYRTVHGLTYEGAARTAAGAPYRDQTNPGCPSTSAGRPRSSHPPGGLLDKCNLAEGGGSMMPRGTLAQGASGKAQADRASGHKEGQIYACEDCGQGFKDAPSRNRHQNLVHYTEEGQEVGQTKG